MPHIQAVTGKLATVNIKFCHCHDHLMISKGKSYSVNKSLCIDDYKKTLSELNDFFSAGGTTIVDAQPVGCNRVAQSLVNLSMESKVQIIASTGFHKLIFYPENHWLFRYDSEKLLQIFLHEINTGMYLNCENSTPTNYITAKAGIIKCAFDCCGLTPQYEKLFLAATQAAKLTKLPLMVHIEQGSDPLELSQYLRCQNIDLNRVIFCHMDRACDDLNIHKELCQQGIYLEYDTIGRFKYHDDIQEAAIFQALIQSGYEDRLLFSLDTTRERLAAYTPTGIGLSYILHSFIPLLKRSGITDAQLYKISCLNCRRILSIPDTPENHESED